MNDKELKTSMAQRIIIILIAVLMLGSVIAGYALIVVNGSKKSSDASDSAISEAKIMKLEEDYEKKKAEFMELSKKDYERFMKYKGEIKGYNETSVNMGGVETRDLEIGTGKELTADDTEYFAYYVGWCGDESIFDSSFDNNKNPTGFAKILDASLGMIEGWNIGIDGMRLEGIREIAIPSELAYAETMEICGGYNKPLKFLIMAKEKTGSLKKLADELDVAYTKLQYAHYGIDFDSIETE